MANWTDERKAEAVEKYLAAEPTPENSMEIVADIAAQMSESVNGVRMILIKAINADGSQVYLKKAAATATASNKTAAATGDKAPRVSKEAAHARLTTAITEADGTVDSEIVSKLTGKAALYFAEIFEAVAKK